MTAISTQLDFDLNQQIEIGFQGIDHFRDQILLVDNQKEPWDYATEHVDSSLLENINYVNGLIGEVADAYQDRIDAGCRTDLFWQVVGIDTSAAPVVYDLRCTKMVLNGYPLTGLSTIGLGGTGAVVAESTGIVTVSNRYGHLSENLFGLKYLDEPYLKDIGDTSVGSFIGTCTFGTTDLIVMLPESDNLIEDFEVGQLVTCSDVGIFAGEQNKIVGFGTTTADLSRVNAGIGTTTVPVIKLEVNTIGIVTAPQPDGRFITFTVLDDPAGIATISKYEIEFGKNPFSPQTIGILSTTTLGIGKTVYLDNRGNPSEPQSWRPEEAFEGSEDIAAVTAPNVGAGKQYYKEGFTSAPSLGFGGGLASENQIITNIPASNFPLYFQSLNTCSPQEAALSNAISAADNAISEFNSGIGTFNDRLVLTNKLRKERDEYSLRIWGLRQSIGNLADVLGRQLNLRDILGIDLYRTIINKFNNIDLANNDYDRPE